MLVRLDRGFGAFRPTTVELSVYGRSYTPSYRSMMEVTDAY